MALPTNATPVYTIQIPSTKQQFKFRPFVVRDEKALLIAYQSDDVGVMLDTVKDVIKSCAKNEIDVDKLASFDIEYIFLHMRAHSVGEVVELLFACDVDHGADNIKAKALKQINLFDAKVEFFDGHTSNIKLFGDVGVKMKYPSLDTLKKLESNIDSQDVDSVINIAVDCIDYVYDAEEVFPAKDQSRDELVTFVNDLTSDQFQKIRDFFRTMPQLRLYVDYSCPVCGKAHNKYMEGLASFF